MATVDEIIEKERTKNCLDIKDLAEYLYGGFKNAELQKEALEIAIADTDFNIFNKGRVDLLKKGMDIWPRYWERGFKLDSFEVPTYFMSIMIQSPATIHKTMFMKCIDLMGTDRQREEYLSKCESCEIIGCYAQTELGHGSDVQGLETTATYDIAAREYIINTPSISATKFWPGDLGIYATHALVFANLIINEKKIGIHSFIVPVRDPKTYATFPNIEIGDIGPKIGFEGKDNGFLICHNVRIPRKNMLRKFTSVSEKGEIKIKGDPKVSYATMMTIRQSISCFVPRVFSLAIVIAVRYSFFRKQFMNKVGEEVPVINYQSQKEKVLTRLAEVYAITIGGLKIKEISDKNLILVKEKDDFSLMNESHVCLCIGKALFTETCYDGMEICRRACGGHGYSEYSGFPNLMSEFAANLTYEGENTVLYLQVSRYVLKSYNHSLTKKKTLGESVNYLNSFDFIMEKRISDNRSDPNLWTLEDLRTVLAQGVCYLIQLITYKMITKRETMTELDIWNGAAGNNIKRLGHMHSFFYVFDNFKNSISILKQEANKEVMQRLCLLYGVQIILQFGSSIREGGFLKPCHFLSLQKLKETLLDEIKIHAIGLIDGFNIPDHLIRSSLAFKDPYQNLIDQARKCEINDSIMESTLAIRNNIVKVLSLPQAKL